MVLKTDSRDDYKDCATYKSDTITCSGMADYGDCEWCPKFKFNVGSPSTENPIRYTENPNKKVYNIDFDGTLTTGEYTEWPNPNSGMISKVRSLCKKGNVIIIWTARWWEQAGNIAAWLIRHNVPFHGLMMGKGGSDCYVDDKAVSAEDFLKGENNQCRQEKITKKKRLGSQNF